MRNKNEFVLAVVLIASLLAVVPFAQAFTFGSSYGAFASAAAAVDYCGQYNADNSTMTHNQGDGLTTGSASESAGMCTGSTSSSSASSDVLSHTAIVAAADDCDNTNNCLPDYQVGGSAGATMYDTYTATCGSCNYLDYSVNWTISGSFAALDNGTYCQNGSGTGYLVCETTVDPEIFLGNVPICQGYQNRQYAAGCPPTIINYAQGWSFCQTGAYYYYYCPSGASFSLSGTVDLSHLIFEGGAQYTTAYPPSGSSWTLQFLTSADSEDGEPASSSVSATVTYTVYSQTPGATMTSAATGSQIVTPPESTMTTVQLLTNPVAVGSPTTVRAIVSGDLVSPTGTITWSSSGSGSFSPSNMCTLSGTVCSVTYTPSAGGSPVTITANYGGDDSNLASMGNNMLTVTGGSTATTTSTSSTTTSTTSTSSSTSSTTSSSTSSGSIPTTPICPSVYGGVLMPIGATFTDDYGNTWTAPGGTIDGGIYSSYFFVGSQNSFPPPIQSGWGGVYGNYGGQQGWIVSFYCAES